MTAFLALAVDAAESSAKPAARSHREKFSQAMAANHPRAFARIGSEFGSMSAFLFVSRHLSATAMAMWVMSHYIVSPIYLMLEWIKA
jgi:hypothetical protein